MPDKNLYIIGIDEVALMSYVTVGGKCTIGRKVYIGNKVTILPQRNIEIYVLLGSNSVITKHSNNNSRVFGNLAKSLPKL